MKERTFLIVMMFVFISCTMAQGPVDWINQVTHNVYIASTPATDSSYHWHQELNKNQGVGISLMPTEISKIYLETSNNQIRFRTQYISNAFIALDVNIDNSGYSNLYQSGNANSGTNYYDWTNSSGLAAGNHNLKVRFMDLWGTYYYREYEVNVVPQSDALYVDNYGNTLRVWKGNNNDATPLILSEGFDAYNTKSQQYYREAGKDLINCLITKGFDVYIINYNYNAQSMRNNSAVFQSAIRYISSINDGKQVATTGMSMGGVINRFACAKAEADSNPLPISVFMTLDAPLQGAVMSSDLQDWRKQQLDNAAQNGSSDPYGEYQANNDAALELLNYNAYDPSAAAHNAFYYDLNYQNGDGYPHSVKRIGVSFSTNLANPNAVNDEWLYVDVSGVPVNQDKHCYMHPEDLVPGSFLPSLNIDGMAAPSSNLLISLALSILRPISNPWVTITQYKNPTFIPHNSSLDIVSGISKFDTVLIPSVTGFHDVVPSDLVEPIVNALLEKATYIQNKTYSNSNKTVVSRGKFYAGNAVNSTMTQGDVIISSTSNVKFIAPKEILIRPGFKVQAGANFQAKNNAVYVLCDGSTDYQNRMAFNSDSAFNETELQSKQILKNDFAVVPNPNEGEFKIILPNAAKKVHVQVTTLIGSNVCERVFSDVNEINLSLRDKTKGSYIIKVDADNIVYTRKVIVD